MGVITEYKLRDLLKNKELTKIKTFEVPKGTIITPSARTFLQDQKIKLSFVEELDLEKSQTKQYFSFREDETKSHLIEVEASGRHVHLSRESIDLLFGKGYELTKVRELSQPGQYVCKERVTLIGPKSILRNVVILGPERKKTQVELSLTDAVALGLKVPIRESGDLAGSASIVLATENKILQMEEGVIVAKRHIHMTPEDAEKFQVKDKQLVKVQVLGTRPLIFDEVLVRVHQNYQTRMHIDYDEANACGFQKGTLGRLIK